MRHWDAPCPAHYSRWTPSVAETAALPPALRTNGCAPNSSASTPPAVTVSPIDRPRRAPLAETVMYVCPAQSEPRSYRRRGIYWSCGTDFALFHPFAALPGRTMCGRAREHNPRLFPAHAQLCQPEPVRAIQVSINWSLSRDDGDDDDQCRH